MATKEIKHKKTTVFIIHVDDEDAELLSYKWQVDFKLGKGKSAYFRIKRSLSIKERKVRGGTKISLHKQVWEKHFGPIPQGMTIDHIDFNTTNNKKENLQLLTPG